MYENVKSYLLDGCHCIAELEDKEFSKIREQYDHYIDLFNDETLENRKVAYFNMFDHYRKALESPFYKKSAALNTIHKNIATILDDKNLLTTVYLNNITKNKDYEGKDYVEYFVSLFGEYFISREELINMRYEDIRKILYKLIDLEFVPIDVVMAKNSQFQNGIHFKDGKYPVASFIKSTTFDGQKLLIEGANLVKDNKKIYK